jgi:hypothetical protein
METLRSSRNSHGVVGLTMVLTALVNVLTSSTVSASKSLVSAGNSSQAVAANIKLSDLPDGWFATAFPKLVLQQSTTKSIAKCLGVSTRQVSLLSGGASSLEFVGPEGTQVQSNVGYLSSESAARDLFNLLSKEPFCLERAPDGESGLFIGAVSVATPGPVRTTVATPEVKEVHFPKIGSDTMALLSTVSYRQSDTAVHPKGYPVHFYRLEVVIRKSRAVAVLLIAGEPHGFNQHLGPLLARLIGSRLAG